MDEKLSFKFKPKSSYRSKRILIQNTSRSNERVMRRLQMDYPHAGLWLTHKNKSSDTKKSQKKRPNKLKRSQKRVIPEMHITTMTLKDVFQSPQALIKNSEMFGIQPHRALHTERNLFRSKSYRTQPYKKSIGIQATKLSKVFN